MSEIKLPVRWLKEKGIKLVVGDKFKSFGNSEDWELKHNTGHTAELSIFDFLSNDDHLTSFAYRENTGDQPVDGWVPVVWHKDRNAKGNTYLAEEVEWSSLVNNPRWKPNIEALYKIYETEMGDRLKARCRSVPL